MLVAKERKGNPLRLFFRKAAGERLAYAASNKGCGVATARNSPLAQIVIIPYIGDQSHVR
jgi:hypothetical protein